MPRRWTIRVRPEVMRALYRLSRGEVMPLTDAINALQNDPKPLDCQPIADFANGYEIKVGNDRIVYQVLEQEKVVRILEIV